MRGRSWLADFFVTVTMGFRLLYVFVVMEAGSRRIAHFNVTAHPTADWILQQFREVVTGEQCQRFLIRDRDGIYSAGLDSGLRCMGLAVLKTPVRAPQGNAFCERLVGTIRRECLDFLIPINEQHLRGILKEWVAHYNRGRSHSSLGPGIPEPGAGSMVKRLSEQRIPTCHRVLAKPILGGLHHEYRLERVAASQTSFLRTTGQSIGDRFVIVLDSISLSTCVCDKINGISIALSFLPRYLTQAREHVTG